MGRSRLLGLCILWIFDACFGTDDFLFGTTGTNQVWIQNGTKNWIDTKQNPTTSVINFSQTFLGVHGTSYFYRRNYLVFSDTGVKSIFLTELSGTNRNGVLVYVGTSSSVGHLAVDWLSGNVYWCDGTFGWIGMLSLPQGASDAGLKRDFKMVAEKFLDIPSGIAVQPDHEWIFWTDIGRQPKIERAGLDGIERNVLVLHGLIRPVSITTDPKQANIVWTDPARGTIELCDFYGNNRRVIRTDVNTLYYGIEAYENFVIVSDQTQHAIRVYDMTDGRIVTNPYSPGNLNVSSIALFTAKNQFVNNDACQSKGCDQICLVKSHDDAVCRCEDGYTLSSSNSKSCSVQNKVLVRSIVYVNNTYICSLPITHINIHQYLEISPDCTLGGVSTGSITHLVIDVEGEKMFFSVGMTIYSQVFYQTAIILHSEDSTITGLTYDWITNRLYWTKSGQIKFLDKTLPSTVNSLLTTTTVNNPTYITANPIDDILFVVSEENNKKQIESIFLPNGTSVTLESTRLSDPKWLTYDRPKDRLYWVDGTSIGSISSSGRGINIRSVGGSDTLHGIGAYKDYVMWLQSSPSAVAMHVENINSEQEKFNFPMPYMTLNPSTFVFFDRHIQPEKNVPCLKDNGGCEQICAVHGVDPKCDCHLGYTLQSDSKTCRADTLQTNFFLTIDTLYNKLLKLNGSSTIVALDTGNISPTSVATDYQSKSVVWIDSGDSIKSISVDGSNEVTITAESVDSLTSVDVDSSTGNIYYTTKESLKVYSARYSTKRTLLTGITSADNLALFPAKGKMYWTEKNNGAAVIKQAFMDGSDVRVIRSGVGTPSDLAIDFTDNRIIWADVTADIIESISLSDNNDRRTLLSGTGESPVAVVVDSQYVYYIGVGQREIRKINKADGTGAAKVFENVLIGRLISLMFVSTNQRSDHALCKSNNGQCSRLCLPRGENQRMCQCPDGVNLATDGKKCIGDVQCPEQHGDVILSQSCTRYAGASCSFDCASGTNKNTSFNLVTCLQKEQWDAESSVLCPEITCPEPILHGILSSACTRKTGRACSFKCNTGYEKKFDTLVCQSNGEWSEDTSTVCAVTSDTGGTSGGLSTGAIVGLAGGGIVLMVIVVAVVVVFQLKKMRKETKKTRNEMRVVYNVSTSGGQFRDLGASGYSDIYPPREPEETYEVIDDEKLFREKTTVAQELSASSSSHRYSKWPIDDPTEDPPPDYLEVIANGNGNSPYLNPKFLAPKPENSLTSGADSPYLTPKSFSNSAKDSSQPRSIENFNYGGTNPQIMHDNRGFQRTEETNPYMTHRNGP